jgi:hypothetical protein
LKKLLIAIILGGAALAAIASVLIHPSGEMKKNVSDGPLFAGSEVSSPVLQIVQRSCQDCHSEKTAWPWYSYVAPMSWLIEKDVQQGRSHMNLSHWDQYDTATRVEVLTKLSAMVRSREMPLPRYLRLHPESRLSDAEVDVIYQWARAERKRLKQAVPPTEQTQP